MPAPARVPLSVIPDHPCPYLPLRVARSRALWADQMPAKTYHAFMDAGFRRSGKVIYQPMCNGCRACQPIRVPVERFRPTKSQRRCSRRNADLTVAVAAPVPTSEKYELYVRYIREWHGGAVQGEYDGFVSFLYDSPVESAELCYRDASGRLLAVGICDVSGDSLSSVYHYFDPGDASRGLGTFGALWEIEHARQRKIAYYYLGYWIDGCRSMEYKSTIRPYEILWPDQVWRAKPVDKPSAVLSVGTVE
jgi:arginyl-tRNA--protein-N-Asp/Glu arginylyltransferase